MASRREAVIQAIETLLQGAALAGVTVHRYRTRPIDSDDLPAWVVYPFTAPGGESERAQRRTLGGQVDRILTVRVELRVVAAPPLAPDAALDPHYVAVVRAMLGAPTLGGLSLDIEERATSFDAVERDQVYAAAGVDFEVTYATLEADPETGV